MPKEKEEKKKVEPVKKGVEPVIGTKDYRPPKPPGTK